MKTPTPAASTAVATLPPTTYAAASVTPSRRGRSTRSIATALKPNRTASWWNMMATAFSPPITALKPGAGPPRRRRSTMSRKIARGGTSPK